MIHVVSAIIATGAFTLGGIISALYLVKDAREHREPTGYLARLPSLARRSTGCPTGCTRSRFPVWTFAVLITGPIWAHQAWSSYWNWDPKEVWAFITWVVYAAYLHARTTAGWKGRNAADPGAGRRRRRCGSTSSGSTTSRRTSQHSLRRGRARRSWSSHRASPASTVPGGLSQRVGLPTVCL